MRCNSHYNMEEATECMIHGPCSEVEEKVSATSVDRLSIEQLKKEFDWRTAVGAGNQPGWIFRPLYEAFIKFSSHTFSGNKKYIIVAIGKAGAKVELEVSKSEARRILGLMKKKFFFARSELNITSRDSVGKNRLKLNMKEFPVFNIHEREIESNPLEKDEHYEDPNN